MLSRNPKLSHGIYSCINKDGTLFVYFICVGCYHCLGYTWSLVVTYFPPCEIVCFLYGARFHCSHILVSSQAKNLRSMVWAAWDLSLVLLETATGANSATILSIIWVTREASICSRKSYSHNQWFSWRSYTWKESCDVILLISLAFITQHGGVCWTVGWPRWPCPRCSHIVGTSPPVCNSWQGNSSHWPFLDCGGCGWEYQTTSHWAHISTSAAMCFEQETEGGCWGLHHP